MCYMQKGFHIGTQDSIMRVYVNHEAFELIEKRRTITPKELAKAIGIKEHSAATWLSKWASRGYLVYVHSHTRQSRKAGKPVGSYGYYTITNKCRWWGELVYESEKLGG